MAIAELDTRRNPSIMTRAGRREITDSLRTASANIETLVMVTVFIACVCAVACIVALTAVRHAA